MPGPADHALLYDADCGFCTRMLDLVLRADRRGRLRPVAIQDEEGQRLLAPIPEAERLSSWHLVGPDGTIHSGGAAAAPLARLLPFGALPARTFERFPRLTERAYRWVAGHRGLLGRILPLLAMAVVLGGCGSGVQEDSRLSVYVSAPLRGGEAAAGRDIADGATLALERAGGEAAGVPVSLERLDAADRRGDGLAWTQARVAENARAATSDSLSIGYIGERSAAATAVSVPITNVAGLLQVVPAPTAEELLREPGSNDVPERFQTTGERTVIALLPAGAEPRARLAGDLAEGFEAATGREPGPLAAYGYEAMALLLDSIARASDPLNRGAVISAALATSDRGSVLGTYSVDAGGLAATERPDRAPPQRP